MNITIPAIADGIESGVVISLLVAEGDSVNEGDDVLELETDKATAQIPSPGAGTISKIHVNVGDTVKIGQSVMEIGGEASSEAPKAAAAPSVQAPAQQPQQPTPAVQKVSGGGELIAQRVPAIADGIESGVVISILVDEGAIVKEGEDLIELETDKATAPIPATVGGKLVSLKVKVGETLKVGQVIGEIQGEAGSSTQAPSQQEVRQSTQTVTPAQPTAPVAAQPFQAVNQKLVDAGLSLPAAPSVRKMARTLGIALGNVPGTASGGRITLDDLKHYVQALQSGTLQASAPAPAATAANEKKVGKPLPDFSKFGEIEEQKLPLLRRKIAEQMELSWTTIPHVTQYHEADITDAMPLAKTISKKEGVKITLTVLLFKAIINMLKKYPKFNATIDLVGERIVYKKYYNLGIAVDTEQGLIVPVLKDADKKSLKQLSTDLTALAEKTRARKVSLDDLQGASFTISNQGGIGGGAFTPIINPPEVAILGLAKGMKKPVVKDGEVQVRMMLPLALSYDHRLIDGGDAARFISDLVSEIESLSEDKLK